jgi:hypothetical protein
MQTKHIRFLHNNSIEIDKQGGKISLNFRPLYDFSTLPFSLLILGYFKRIYILAFIFL